MIGKVGFAQKNMPFYEQIAFDHYSTTIIDSFPVKKRIKVYMYAFDFQPILFYFYTPRCLTDIVWKSNSQFQPFKKYVERQWNIDSNLFKLDFSNLNKKQFKIKKNGKGTYPKLFISPPYKEKENDDRIFVNIYEKHNKRKEVIYHLELNQFGIIKNWCQSVSETIIIH